MENKLNRIVALLAVSFSIFFLFDNPLEAKSGIFSNIDFTLNEDTLNLSININNLSNKDIYIQIKNWDIDGQNESNWWWSFCTNPFLMNQITYFPDKYKIISYKEIDEYNLANTIFPKYLVIHKKDQANIRIKMVDFKSSLKRDINYRFKMAIPYLNLETIDSISSFLRLDLKELIIDRRSVNLLFERVQIKPELGKNELWVLSNLGFDTKRKLSENEAEKISFLFNSNLLRSEGILKISKASKPIK